jgi:acetyl esterase
MVDRFRRQFRRRVGAAIVDNFFRGISAAGKLHPRARPHKHSVEVIPDVPYRDSGLPDHRLDVYRPTNRSGPFPTVLYVHGGGFRILSKDTHWVMALAFARRGYQVFNINYRLAPRHRFPAAVEDACAAYAWLAENARAWDVDPSRVVLAGESAGANLVTALAVASSFQRDEPWARAVYDAPLRPRAVLPYCGILQVSDSERFWRRKPTLSTFLRDRIMEVCESYLGRDEHSQSLLHLANPLLFLESEDAPHRPLPPFFAPVGTADPILDDTRRLKAALDRRGVTCETRYYVGEVHAFHALIFRPNARRCWQHTFEFLERHLQGDGEGAGPAAGG